MAVFAVLCVVLSVAGIVGAIVLSFRAHDPTRARAFASVRPDGSFLLELPPGASGTLWFRFLIDGDTDYDYDLLVRGEIEDDRGAKRGFAHRTQSNSAIEGAEHADDVRATHAVTTTTGSFVLARIEPSDRRVRGAVGQSPNGLLAIGHVYLP